MESQEHYQLFPAEKGECHDHNRTNGWAYGEWLYPDPRHAQLRWEDSLQKLSSSVYAWPISKGNFSRIFVNMVSIVPGVSTDRIRKNILFPAIRLAMGYSQLLLPAMVCCLNRRLCTFANTLVHKLNSQLFSRIEMPYIYLMVWLTMHYPTLIAPGFGSSRSQVDAFICWYEDSKWSIKYLAGIRKVLQKGSGHVSRCL